MKHFLSLFFFLAALPCLAQKALSLADPFILLDNGVYYAYGTSSDNGIEVFTSTNLHTWRKGGLALRREDTSCEKWFWAPEVYRIAEGRYLMYFSGNEKIRAAWGSSPTGPFHEIASGPMFATEGNIDHHLFIDDDGTPYIFFVRFDRGNIIHSCKLAQDLTTMQFPSLHFVLRPTADWEKKQAVVTEGPFVIKHNDTYYLTYSANDYQSPDYAIGTATAPSPAGPWTKAPYNPILHSPGKLRGVGHHSFFRDTKGQLRIVFHAHQSESKIHPRTTHIATASFKPNPNGGPDILSIDEKSIVAALESE